MSTPQVFRRVALAAVLSLPVALAVGCGGSKSGEVSGKITIKGKTPRSDGLTISFVGADGRTAAAMVGTDGAYSAKGVPAGAVKIALVYQHLPAEGKTSKPTKGAAGDAEALKQWENAMKAAETAGNAGIPEKVRDPNTSGLVMTVEPNKMNDFSYDVK